MASAELHRHDRSVVLPDRIETPRLALRPWSLGDVADVLAYAADEDWGRYLPIAYPYGEADAHAFVAGQIALDRREHFAWAIALDGLAIGGINLQLVEAGRIAEIDYAIARACWGRGFATEVVGALVDAAFRSIDGLIRVRSCIDARNAASARVLQKTGMKREAMLRSNKFARGEAIDEVWYGMLRDEWGLR